jgi:hypothetical protein
LQIILSNNYSDLDTYVWRLTEDGPLFMDRKSSYSTNPGSIGMLFETKVITPAPHHRYYGVFSVQVNDLRVCMTGEVDGVAKNG